MNDKIVILNIGKLDNRLYAGPNINVPIFVKKLNEICCSGYLDVGNNDIDSLKDFQNFFRMCDYKKFDISLLPKPFNEPDIVVFQGFYKYECAKIAKQLVKQKIPYTIVPRCSLTKESQKSKRIKKIVGNFFVFNRFVRNAKFIHFLTENEYVESKKAFKFQDYIIVGNGVNLPNKSYVLKNRDEFKIVFIGRYNVYHKGIDFLFKSVLIDRDYFINNNIKIVMYGKDSDNGLSFMKEFIDKNSLNDIIIVNDGVFGKDKEKALLDADMFIHTSRLEGQPTSVIEAISYGIPVIVTPGTNITDIVQSNDFGYICELDERNIFKCIKTAYEQKSHLEEISKNEIEYSKSNFGWDKIIERLITEYTNKLKR